MKQPLSLVSSLENGVAMIKICGDIFEWRNSAVDFESSVTDLIARGAKDVQLYLKSDGGSCFEANEIVNIIKKFPGAITGTGGSVVASAAAYIAVNCTTFSMPSNGIFMIHKPSIDSGGNVDELKSDVKLLEILTDEYCKAFAKKTGMSEAEITDLWKSECWMGSQEALDKHFIDSIAGEEPLTESLQETVTNWKYATIPVALIKSQRIEPTTINPKSEIPMKKIALALGRPESSSEDDLTEAVTTLKKTVTDLQAQVKTFTDEKTLALKEEATALIDSAVKDGRINAEAKDHFTKMFASDHATAKAALATLKPRVVVHDKLNPEAKPEDKLLAMTFDELDKAGKLKIVKEKYPEAYAEKFEEKFGTKPTKYGHWRTSW